MSSFTVNVESQAEFTEWKNSFEAETHTQYTATRTRRNERNKVRFKQYLKCLHHKRKGKIGNGNNTACPARITVTIRQSTSHPRKVIRGCTESKEEKFSCLVQLCWWHNHTIIAGDVLRRHTASAATEQKLVDLYKHGHSPKSALQYLKAEIEENAQDDDLHIALADRSICPDLVYCHYIFKKLFKRKYGNPEDSVRLEDFINDLNIEYGETIARQEVYDGKSLIAICTPLMKRVHQNIQEAAELMFVDSSGSFERDGYRIFLFITHSKAGGSYRNYSFIIDLMSLACPTREIKFYCKN